MLSPDLKEETETSEELVFTTELFWIDFEFEFELLVSEFNALVSEVESTICLVRIQNDL